VNRDLACFLIVATALAQGCNNQKRPFTEPNSNEPIRFENHPPQVKPDAGQAEQLRRESEDMRNRA
jgi:hypothetical protein